MSSGTIFDIKEFAVYDGPGIRLTVFFKGCPIKCNWCHNPEGQNPHPELMVNKASCISCGQCKEACTQEKCIACGKCITCCPLNLRKICGYTLTAEELTEYINDKSDYYAKYGGGVTFSGGEPLMQPQFLTDTLSLLKDIHTAVETSGYADNRIFTSVAEMVDYVIMDVKLIDSKLHLKYTGVDNRIILENLESLCKGNTKFVVRIPVIPGVNDNASTYRSVAKLIKDAPMLEQIELLPYHKTAGAKYEMINRKYEPIFDVNRPVFINQDIFSQYGIRSAVL
ncbi:MAG: glycyl-radical enzyme activating protein [Clostridiales bacterium]|nr:glycyl-radical enzyme activating protein [Clostridiales bacterium]